MLWRWPRQLWVLLLSGFLGLYPLLTQASEATQCANAKKDADPDTCKEWVNGNLNHTKAEDRHH